MPVVGGGRHRELWGPAAELSAFDRQLRGREAHPRAPFPSTATWQSLAVEGARAASVLAPLLVDPAPGIEVGAVARQLAVSAPAVLREWLSGPDAPRQRIALRALRSVEPTSGVETSELVALLPRLGAARTECIAWLASRDDLGGNAASIFVWLGEQVGTWHLDVAQEFAAQHALPTEQMLELLGPSLQDGRGWELVLNGDRVALRAACRTWFAAASDESTHARLAAAMARLGPVSDDDVAIVLAGLRGPAPQRMLDALEAGGDVPPGVLTGVAELIDARDSFVRFSALRILRGRHARR